VPGRMTEEDRFDWWAPLRAAAAVVIIFLLLIISSADLGPILFLLVLIPLGAAVLLTLAFRKKGRRRLTMVSTVIVCCVLSAVLVVNDAAIREAVRWALWSSSYKSEVLRQPDSGTGELRHVEWDGWGFAGAGNTVVYVVLDPTDSLAAEVKSHASGKFRGIPCEVHRVRRLEDHWYSVLLYTDTEWGRCY
jgi:hypothetical protein